MIPGSILNV